MAYTTIRPPVDLTFELICPVNIHHIKLFTTVGNQKCTCIEIEAKISKSTEFKSIAKSHFDASTVVFQSTRANVHQSFPDCKLFYFNRYAFRSFTNAIFVKVKILQTQRSVPCLGGIEIWGKPSKLCSPTTLVTINQLFNKSNSNVVYSLEAQKEADNGFKIPEEFKDSLTFELMSLPMTLPSGNTVDQTTIEKHIQNEANYGRQPSDPFTGIQYSEKCKPVFNAALKSRIDMFLLHNKDRSETFKIHRTLGVKPGKETRNQPDTEVETRPSKRFKCRSLDEDIKAVMSCSSFIHFSSTVKSAKDNSCVVCETDDVSNLYILTCKHLYCKKCLLDACNARTSCHKCKTVFSKIDAKKFHVGTSHQN